MIPDPHKEDSLKLNPEELLELFEVTLVGGSKIYANNGPEVEWSPTDTNNPLTFESVFIKLSNAGRNSGEQRVRPTLTVGNPMEMFHVPIAQGHLDGAEVIRYKVKPSLLKADPPVFEKSMWYIAHIRSLGEVITVQLRSLSDRQEGLIPIRQYLKPEFPSVTI